MGKSLTDMNRPRRVVLIGSSRFKDLFHKVGAKLEKSGVLVLCMSFFQHADDVEVTPEDRETLRWVDMARIDLADEVFVIDGPRAKCQYCGEFFRYMCYTYKFQTTCSACGSQMKAVPYIGEDTRKEIMYAESQSKPISYYSKDNVPCLESR